MVRAPGAVPEGPGFNPQSGHLFCQPLTDIAYEVAYSSTAAAEPLSYSEALRHPDAEQWKQAALEELNAHSTNGTWELVPRPKGKKIISYKWVFKVKRNAASGKMDIAIMAIMDHNGS